MRKVILAVLIMLLGIVGYTEATTQTCLTYNNENNTGADVSTEVSTSTIIPGIHKIISYTVMPLVDETAAGAFAAIYSGTTADTQNLIGESEAAADRNAGEFWAYPKHVKDGGITIKQSPYSIVIIEYTR